MPNDVSLGGSYRHRYVAWFERLLRVIGRANSDAERLQDARRTDAPRHAGNSLMHTNTGRDFVPGSTLGIAVGSLILNWRHKMYCVNADNVTELERVVGGVTIGTIAAILTLYFAPLPLGSTTQLAQIPPSSTTGAVYH